MHLEALTADQIAVLEGVKPLPAVHGFYLAGGTALALRHGHRRSVDFDWFREDAFDDRMLLSQIEGAFDAVEHLPSGQNTVYMRIHAVTSSFFRFPYPLLEPVEHTPWGFGLASNVDLAAMKLEAIAGRGSRKDFVDLYLLCQQGISLDDVLRHFDEKFGTDRLEHYHRLRALSYFGDAEAEPMPDMLTPLDWGEVVAFFEQSAARMLAELAR